MRTAQSTDTILDAALAVYGRQGARRFSMRAVGDEAGITATAIYRHFSDKAALASAMVERARRTLGSYLLEGLQGSDSLERLWSCAASYVRFVFEHPELYRLLFMDPLDERLPDVHAMRAGEDAAPFRFMIDRIREAMDAGLLAPGDPGFVALSVWAHVHGLCTLYLSGRVPTDDLQTLCRASLGHLYEGLERRQDDE